ncbi:MAG: aminoglycoside/choline kinase family phosphotransferase [Paracoccaceae bacterium]|jgi:aminoglycoside/choline kinase family phosphotransferase
MSTAQDKARHQFIESAGWGAASVTPLPGDASARRYFRLALRGKRSVLMHAPKGQADDPAAFLSIGRFLQSLGLSAPKTFAQNLEKGFLLLEDFGDNLYARLLGQSPELELPLYKSAAHVLTHVHKAEAPLGVANLSCAEWAKSSDLAFLCYGAQFGVSASVTEGFIRILTELLVKYADNNRVFILRDYHAENLLWLPERQGLARVGLLDFQLGQMGQSCYDLVSLLQDARREVSLATQAATLRHFLDISGQGHAAFMAAYSAFGAQRAARILGIFTRLALAGKPQYLKLIPRVWRDFNQNLEHPALRALKKFSTQHLPEPTTLRLQYLEKICPKPK